MIPPISPLRGDAAKIRSCWMAGFETTGLSLASPHEGAHITVSIILGVISVTGSIAPSCA